MPGVDELLVESLAQFLVEGVEKQFWAILSEVDQRSTTKLNVKDNATTEKEAEQ